MISAVLSQGLLSKIVYQFLKNSGFMKLFHGIGLYFEKLTTSNNYTYFAEC